MNSRARLLLEKELFKMRKEEPPWGIEAGPLNEDDMFIWVATVKGAKDTMWEGGVFKLYLQFSETFNTLPPKVYFHTVPFHPNVDPETGQPCVDFLDESDEWKSCYSVFYILLSIQMMLSNPVAENAVNSEAAQMLVVSPAVYRQTVLDCVLASKRIEAGLKPHIAEDVDLTQVTAAPANEPTSQQKKRTSRLAKVSFEDYHSLWSGIATTKPVPSYDNPLGEVFKSDSKLQTAHFGLPHKELQDEIHKQLTEHNALMYGSFERSKGSENLNELKASKIQLLRQIYLPKQQGSSDTSCPLPTAPSPSAVELKDLEPAEDEVDELLVWSSSLPQDHEE